MTSPESNIVICCDRTHPSTLHWDFHTAFAPDTQSLHAQVHVSTSTLECMNGSNNLQIEVREVSADPNIAGNAADKQHFMFQVFRVVKKIMPGESQDPEVRLGKALLARSRNAGPQEELWIANSIAQLKAQGQLGSLSQDGQVKGVQRFREVAEHVGHVAQVVAQLNKLKLRLNDGVSRLHTAVTSFVGLVHNFIHQVAVTSKCCNSMCVLQRYLIV